MKEKERLKNTIFFLELFKKVIKMEDSQKKKKQTKNEIEKKRRKMEKHKKGRHLEKRQQWYIFQESNGVKKRGGTELECKTGVKHNSKQYVFEN